jgi:hypothetical protein
MVRCVLCDLNTSCFQHYVIEVSVLLNLGLMGA